MQSAAFAHMLHALLQAPGLASLRGTAGEASLFLLVGGLVMLTLIVVLVLLQNLFPETSAAQEAAERPPLRQLRPLDGGPVTAAVRRGTRRRPARPRATAAAPIDLALDRVVELHLGEPRLLQSQPRGSRLRLYGCRGCSFTSTPAANGTSCVRERAALEEVFGAVFGSAVRANESSCRRRGDAACEFEVVH